MIIQVFTHPSQKIEFSITDFFSEGDQIRRKLRIWSHLLKKSVMENFIFRAVSLTDFDVLLHQIATYNIHSFFVA